MRLRRVFTYLPPVLGVLVLAGVVIGLHRALRHVGLGDVLAAIRATPGRQLLRALFWLAVSLCVMAVYDVPGIVFARRLVDFPRLGAARIGFASFCAYSLCHVLGAPALSAAAIRLRLYAQWQVPPAGIARIVTISGASFSLGLASLLSFLLLLHPWDVPLFGHALPHIGLRGVGAVLACTVAAYVLAARRRAGARILRWNVALPGGRLALAQIFLSVLDITVACGIFFAVLPAAPGLSYAHVLGIYLAAFAGGLYSGLPGGVGVFDSLLLLGLAGDMAAAPALAAILLFRVLYFLFPALAAALCYAGHEFWINTRKRR